VKYLVTGGAGFIGSFVTAKLIENGHSVTIIDDFSSSTKETVHPKATLVEGSILDPAALKKAIQGIDGVFHLAAEVSVPASMKNPQKTLQVNALGTLRILEAMKSQKVDKIVYSSTSAVYGDRGQTPNTEDLTPRPLSPYAYSKLQGEYFIKTYTHLHGIKSVIFRYFNVFGPGQKPDSPYAAVIPIFLDRIRQQKPLTIFGDGTQTRDFIFVNDVAQANLLAMQSDFSGEVINIGTGHAISLLELTKLLNPTQIIHEPAREGDILHSSANIEKAKTLLSFTPKTTLQEGLKEML